MTVAELFARIGIKADDSQVKRLSSTMKTAKAGMVTLGLAAGGTALLIKKITTEAMAGAVALKQFEVETGASAQELQKWQAVAEQTNQSAESVTNAIKAIAANQEKIKLGQGNISGFQMLGIDPRQDPFKILEQLRDKTDGVSSAMKKNLLAQLGVGTGLIQTLELSRKEFDAMASRAFIISPAAIETMNKTKASVDLAGRAIKYIKAQITVGLSPQIEKLTKQFTAFIKVNERAIIKGFQQGFKFVKLFTNALMNTARIINNVVTGTVGWERALKGIAVAFGVFNAVMMASPIGLIVAGIILLIAVMDDLYVYSKGGNSLFGDLMKKFPEVEEKMLGFVDKIKDVFSLIRGFISGDDLAITNILEQWGLFGDIIQFVYDKITALSNFLKENDIFNKIKTFVDENDLIEKGVGAAKFIGKTTVNPIGAGIDMWSAVIDKFKDITGVGRGETNITQNVYGSSDPVATGNTAVANLRRELNAASAQTGFNE